MAVPDGDEVATYRGDAHSPSPEVQCLCLSTPRLAMIVPGATPRATYAFRAAGSRGLSVLGLAST